MKIRPSVILILAFGIILVVVLLFLAKNPQSTKQPDSSGTTATSVTPNAVVIPVHSNTTPASTPNPVVSAKFHPESKAERMAEILSSYNDVPIVFYGKVEDQFGAPVPGAEINFSVRIITGMEGNTTQYGNAISDADGKFTITGYHGQDIGMGAKKTGYAWVAMNGTGNYSKLYPENERAHPDPNHPTIIKMWKLQGAEPLVSISQRYKIPFTGEPIYFDFVTGEVVPAGGDLKVIVTRTPGVITQRQPDRRDWSIELVPVNGGIIEPEYNTSHVTFEAPADGYQDSYQVRMNHDDPAWFDNIQKAFFLKSRNGQIYSKFSLNFEINDDPNGPMRFQFKGVANTNGSRNWEATVPQ